MEPEVKRKKNKKFRKPNILPKPQLEEARNSDSEDAMLSEFSDDYNDFYVDEVGEKEYAAGDDNPEEEKEEKLREHASSPSRKKPVSPFRRKLRRIISYVVIITVVIVIGVILSLTVLFKTRGYEVIGNTLYNESDIVEVCDIGEGTNIFLAPKQPAAERIKASFPYFEDVKVGFKIPDTIKIEVTEAVEGYLIKIADNEYLVISTKGRILNRVADKSQYDLPIFIGPKLISGDIGDYVEYEDDTVVDMIENITQVFADNGYQGITEVDATNTAGITFTYEGRIKVKLGIPEDISYKIRTAMTIITTKIDVVPGSQIRGTLDVSRCNDTKRSYFDEDKSIDVNASNDPTTPTEQPGDTGGYDNGSYDTGDGGYDTGDGGYDTGDGGYGDGGNYSDEGGYDNGGYDAGDGGYDNSGDNNYEWSADGGEDIPNAPGNGAAEP